MENPNSGHDHARAPQPNTKPLPPYLRIATVFLAIAAVIYLLTSHWLHVLDALSYLFVIAMLAMHLFGHGHGGHGHGGHGGHGGGAGREGAGNAR